MEKFAFQPNEVNDFMTFPPVMADVPWTKAETLYEKVLNSPGRNFVALLLNSAVAKIIDDQDLSALDIFRWAKILATCQHTEARPNIPPDEVLLLARERKVI